MTRYDLICKFFRLPDFRRRALMDEFCLTIPQDRGRSSIDKYRRAFHRAVERGISDALFRRLAEECQGTHSHYCRGYHLGRRKAKGP